ncbi:MAG TPA: purine-nucleoside phosphorylase [Haliangiales bacterium]|nr:purine-nucleoside phosphorylase [Haliangiales bacterium]
MNRRTLTTLSVPLYEQLHVAVAAIRAIDPRPPTLGIVLGSGLGGFADRLARRTAIDYGDIPHFPVSAVLGHAGKLVLGELHGKTIAAMQGRAHAYEGHDLGKVTFPIRTLVLLGCETLILTNAAGGVNPKYIPGELVVLSDHINMLADSPLRGAHDERLGPRFPDMTHAYASELRELAKAAGKAIGLTLREGVYAAMPGPQYETPAEVRMLRVMGADLTGMSTVPETIVANHMGARVLGISCVTNMAAGITGAKLSHDEVTETARRARSTFERLLDEIIKGLK